MVVVGGGGDGLFVCDLENFKFITPMVMAGMGYLHVTLRTLNLQVP